MLCVQSFGPVNKAAPLFSPTPSSTAVTHAQVAATALHDTELQKMLVLVLARAPLNMSRLAAGVQASQPLGPHTYCAMLAVYQLLTHHFSRNHNITLTHGSCISAITRRTNHICRQASCSGRCSPSRSSLRPTRMPLSTGRAASDALSLGSLSLNPLDLLEPKAHAE